MNKNQFPYERLRTRTRFETEAKATQKSPITSHVIRTYDLVDLWVIKSKQQDFMIIKHSRHAFVEKFMRCAKVRGLFSVD